jgi:ABC-2 type transport system ATP-binding protein
MTSDAATLANVSKSYGKVQALTDVNFTIEKGSTVALLGSNGAGKTTTLRILLGLLQPETGVARLLGGSPKAAEREGRVGAMLQDVGLMPGVRVGELLNFGHDIQPHPLPVSEVLETAGLKELTKRRVDRLSGGQTQRLRFALAIIGDPEFLVLDEPTAALDVEGRAAFWDKMHAYAQAGRTLLFATHYLEEADENADRVIIIARGSVVADGPPSLLRARAKGNRIVRFTMSPTVSIPFDGLPGVTAVELHGDSATLHTTDSDATVWSLCEWRHGVRDLEVTSGGLKDAFLSLTT